jgi:hypothetical protein
VGKVIWRVTSPVDGFTVDPGDLRNLLTQPHHERCPDAITEALRPDDRHRTIQPTLREKE